MKSPSGQREGRERDIEKASEDRERARERENERARAGRWDCRTYRVWMNNHGNSSSSRRSGGINIKTESVRAGTETLRG